jgi:thiamine-monophosphate kinase
MTRLDGLGESELLRRILPYLQAPPAAAAEGLVIAAGADDAAVWREGDHYTVASCDTSVEGIHFDLRWMTAEDAGWRALALALGDLAAKGASPTQALAALAAPGSWPVDHVVGLYRGMHALAARHGLAIVGGDTSSTAGPAVLTLTVLGHTELLPLARAQVKPGWSVAVSAPLGAAAVALRERRALRIEPAFADGRRLNAAGLCCGDISDGLMREMEKFSDAAGVGCVIRANEVPCAEGASLDEALTSGEEPVLVCAGPEDRIVAAGLAPIGTLTAGTEVRAIDGAGRLIELKSRGYDHFA